MARTLPVQFRSARYYPAVLIAPVVVVVACAIGIAGASDTVGQALFRLALLAIPVSVLTYGYGFRIAYWLGTDGTTLHWRAPLRRGRIDLHEVTSIRDALPWVDAIAVRSGNRVVTHVRLGRGLQAFAAYVQEHETAITVTISDRRTSTEVFGVDGFTDTTST